MVFQTIAKRDLQNVGDNIWKAVQIIEEKYHGRLTHDSMHGKNSGDKSTTWIFTFSSYGNAQLALRMNKEKLSLYLREKTCDGRDLAVLLPTGANIEDTYTKKEKGVTSSLLGEAAPFLNPSARNPLLRVKTEIDLLPSLLDDYFAIAKNSSTVVATEVSGSSDQELAEPKRSGARRITTADELLQQLDRNAETGAAGERLVYADELNRLHECGCPLPKNYVELKAISDVGCGYDIASTWPGQERYIEVKTTTAEGSDFFLTENERNVLEKLGEKAWLYRVVLNSTGGEIEARIQNPIAKIGVEDLKPVVWRVAAAASK